MAFAKHPHWEVRSAGTEPTARVKASAGLIGWADVILVMEKRHKEILAERFGEALAEKPCFCLRIPDEFELMDADLIGLLEASVSAHLGEPAMPEDIFDVVNERDEVIGSRPRSEVHRLGLLHRAVHIFVFNSRGELFLQKRSMKKDRHPGVWDSSASGHVDSGEDYDTSAVRELEEEIGLKLAEAPERLFKIDACAETEQEFVWLYRCESEGPFTLNAEEIDCGGWFSTEHLNRWLSERPQDFAPAFVFLWEKRRSAENAKGR